MKRFADLKTASKILFLVFFLSFFMLVIMLIGFYSNSNSGKIMSDMYNNKLLAVGWLGDCMNIVYANEGDLYKSMMAKNTIERDKFLSNIKSRAEKFNKLMSQFEKTKTDDFTKEKSAEMKDWLAKYREVRATTLSLVKAGKQGEAYNYFVSNVEAFEKFSAIVTEISSHISKSAEEMNIQNAKFIGMLSIVLILAAVVSISLSIFIGVKIANMISEPLNLLVKNTREVASGNLSVRDVEINTLDEVGQLAREFNVMSGNLRTLVQDVANSVQEISADSQEVSAAVDQTSQGSQNVSSNITQLAAGTQQLASSVSQLAAGAQEISKNVELGADNIREMNKVVQTISGEANLIAKLVNDTENNANEGREHVKKAVNKIDNISEVAGNISQTIGELGKLSQEIEQIVDLIKNIAGQTNLLALNAAIEAARAGEHGLGFAVVADEVKKLAAQSETATDKITTMIKEIQNKTGVAVGAMNKTETEVSEGVIIIKDAGNVLGSIIDQVKEANTKIQIIHREIDEVAGSSEEIVKMVQNIAAISQQTAASAQEISSVTEEQTASAQEISSVTEEQTASLEEINGSSQALASIAEKLQKRVAVFRI